MGQKEINKRIVQLNKNRNIDIVSNFSQNPLPLENFARVLFMCSFQFSCESIEIPR